MSSPTPNPASDHPALAGFAASTLYDAHRPTYPPSTLTSILSKLPIPPSSAADPAAPPTRILDLGAGTGKFTELLARREEQLEIVAVEPHEGMRRVLEGKGLEGVEVREGGAERIPLGEGSVEGVVYNAPLSWTPTTKWEAKIKDITWSFDDKHPRFRHEQWRKVFDKQLSSTPFTIQMADPLFSLPLGEDSVKFTDWVSKEGIWERYRTISHIAVLEGEQMEVSRVLSVDKFWLDGRLMVPTQTVKRKVFEAMEEDDVEMNEKGEVALHGQTVFYWTTAVPTAPLKSGG
ncbi:hypothetical protein MMC20_004694 [Loxospora ochrophaea]|nr:hypothetical protein [Loxospora ochrophaea]